MNINLIIFFSGNLSHTVKERFAKKFVHVVRHLGRTAWKTIDKRHVAAGGGEALFRAAIVSFAGDEWTVVLRANFQSLLARGRCHTLSVARSFAVQQGRKGILNYIIIIKDLKKMLL